MNSDNTGTAERLIRDTEGAVLLDLSVQGFRSYVKRGLMPEPRRLGRRTRWVLSEVVQAMRRLPR